MATLSKMFRGLRSRITKDKLFPNATDGDSLALSEALERQKIMGITCRGKRDGGGAQVQAIMSAKLFAHVHNVPYFHTPLSRVPFAPGNSRQWTESWETHFGLANGHPPPPKRANFVSTEQFLDGYSGPPPIIEAKHFHGFCDANPDYYRTLQQELRGACQLVRPRGQERPYAAVHIRRGDIAQPNARHGARLTGNSCIQTAVMQIRRTWPEMEVRVFSQGQLADFDFLPDGCNLQLDTDVFETLGEMINADVLMTAKSSFSYVAALLSLGSVIYEPFWHQPLSSWTIRNSDGTF